MTNSGTEPPSELPTEPQKPAESVTPPASGSGKPRTLGMLGKWGAMLAAATCVLAVLALLALSTRDSRAGIAAYTKLTVAVNSQKIEDVKKLCTRRFIQTHTFESAPEGGLVGFPRFIHKNFQAWREGDAVWVCPTNRIGPVYQFLKEDGEWKYDGLIGLLRSGNQMLVLPEESRQAGSDENLIVP